MKGVVVAQAGAPFEVVDTLVKPHPGPKEILVKSLVAGLNPMENFMQGGLLVEGWPIVLGCDASGVVVEVGKDVTKFKVGDGVFGCARIGFPGYMAFQEYLLMDEELTSKRPKNISVEEAATVSVGFLTAALGFVTGTHLKLPDHITDSGEVDEWIIVLGGAGSVGQSAIQECASTALKAISNRLQIAKLNGFKVLTSCSPSNAAVVKKVGADATFDYKTSTSDQLAAIQSITGGNFSRVFDASAQSTELSLKALTEISNAKDKYFATANDWDPIEAPPSINLYKVQLGQQGRHGTDDADKVRKEIISFLPKFEKLLESGTLKPLDYLCAGEGFDGVLDGLKALNEGKGKGKKIVVRLQNA